MTNKIDGMTEQQVSYNVFAMAQTMKRIERKLERARSEQVIARLKRRWQDENIGWQANVKRLTKFQQQ